MLDFIIRTVGSTPWSGVIGIAIFAVGLAALFFQDLVPAKGRWAVQVGGGVLILVSIAVGLTYTAIVLTLGFYGH